MSSYESLTLKYRPRRISELIGQDAAADILKGMLTTGNVSRTNMVSGPYGCGKTTIARLLALHVNCQKPGRTNLADDPCFECQSCKDVLHGLDRDYLEINAADSRGIDTVRSIRDAAQYKPASKYRIFVLDEVHQFTPEASQAFLKILEEPPPSTIFVLCTTDPQRLPKTVLSRCKRITIGAGSPEAAVKILTRVVVEEKLDPKIYNEDMLTKIAAGVNFHPRDAIMTLESVINKIQSRGNVDQKDLDEFLIKVTNEVIGTDIEAIAAEFLLSVYLGKMTTAIKAVQKVTSDTTRHQDFMLKIMNLHEHSMYYRFSPSLQDKMMFAWYGELEKKFPNAEKGGPPNPASLKVDSLVEAMDLFNSVFAMFKRYEGNNYYTLITMATKAALLFKKSESKV